MIGTKFIQYMIFILWKCYLNVVVFSYDPLAASNELARNVGRATASATTEI